MSGGLKARLAMVCLPFWILGFATLISNDRAGFAIRLPQAAAAFAYVQQLHAGQRRRIDGAPFIVHPIEVATLLYGAGAIDDVIAAGVLHDTLGRTDVTAYELYARFGRRVGDIVCALTDDQRIIGYSTRKAALRHQVADAGDDALAVLAADKLSKLREPRLRDGSGIKARSRRMRHDRLCLAMLQQRLPHYPIVAALATELNALSRRGNVDRSR